MTQKIEWGGTPGPWMAKQFCSMSMISTADDEYVCEMDIGSADNGGDVALLDCRAIAEVPAMVHQLRAVRTAVGMLGGLGPLQYAGAIDTIQKTTDAILARIDGEG